MAYPPMLSKLGGAKSIPILCYHSINSNPNNECFPLSPEDFRAHLKYLSANWNVVPLRDVLKHLIDGQPLPKKPVVLTFDDGYRDNFEVALPILEEFKCHATFFVVSGFIEGRVDLIGDPGWEAMSLKQLRIMDASEFAEVGAHTDTHAILSELSNAKVLCELKTCQSILQGILGRSIDLFAYPFGQGKHIASISPKLLTDLGFLGACSTFWRSTQSSGNLFLLNRIMVNQDDNVELLNQKLNGRFDFIYFVHKSTALASVIFKKKGVWR
ncbi:polysaccharide deacetylase family protein [Ekhidna sp.]